jgi:hypothetical protein
LCCARRARRDHGWEASRRRLRSAFCVSNMLCLLLRGARLVLPAIPQKTPQAAYP